MFATVALHPAVSLGQDQSSGEEEDVPFSSARIFSKLWGGDHPEADWGTTFGATNPEDIGKDLYLTVYDKTELIPENEANSELAKKFAVTDGEMKRIRSGNYDIIADKKPGLTQDELLSKVVEIQTEYNWRKEMIELKAQVQASVEMSELFANGDLDDSGFDLINDLTIIEELLFLHTSPIDIGASYTSTSGPGLAPVGQAGGTQAAVSGPEGIKLPPGAGTTSAALEEGGAAEGAAGLTEAQKAAGMGAGGGVNPNACFAGDGFGDALADFEEKSQTDPNYKDGSAAQKAQEQQAGAGQTPDSQLQLDLDDILPAQPGPDLSNLQPAPADNWLDDKLCNEVFCLTVNFVEKPATSSYANSDNCIACHVEKINDVLKTVITHSLVPTKAPGNLGESAQCKKAIADALGLINMNFYAISMPVKTPPNDDLIFGTSVEDEWREFCEQTAFFPFDACKTPEQRKEEIQEEYEPEPILADRAAKKALSETPDDATQEDVIQRVNDTITTYDLQRVTATSKLEQQQQSDEASVFYHPLRIEIDQMNYYFSRIQDILHSLHEPVATIPGPQACTSIKNKEECT